jgi:flagellar biosynthesis protein FlhF
MSIAAVAEPGILINFPRADLRGLLGNALKHHRLPEALATQLVREAQQFPDVSADAALAFALDNRMKAEPIDFNRARGILLVGPAGGGKSAVAAKIMHAATLAGRRTELQRAENGLALFRTRSVRESGSDKKDVNSYDLLTVMEAEGFNPLNARAASAFSALGDIEGVETIGVVSALNDAEDVADIVSAFRFRRVIVTHMDRTRRLGATLAAITGCARLAHVTHGPRAEDALEVLQPGALAALLLDKAQH